MTAGDDNTGPETITSCAEIGCALNPQREPNADSRQASWKNLRPQRTGQRAKPFPTIGCMSSTECGSLVRAAAVAGKCRIDRQRGGETLSSHAAIVRHAGHGGGQGGRLREEKAPIDVNIHNVLK